MPLTILGGQGQHITSAGAYQLIYECFRSWWAYGLYVAVSCVYGIGFVLMTPQVHCQQLLRAPLWSAGTTPHGVLRGAAQRGAQFYFNFAVLRTLFSCSKMSLFYRNKTCTPVEGTPEAPLEVPNFAQKKRSENLG